jgi:hypothetical protein
MDKTGNPWSVPVAVDEIPDTGLHMEIEAAPEIRAAVAELAGVREVAALTAAFDLTRHGPGVHVTGRVRGNVGQTCVVTLEPVDNAVDEAIDVRFIPGADAGTATGHELHVQDVDEEPPEPLVGNQVDLGQLATEFLILGIDPYPRKPGAAFTPPAVEDAGEHPFAALEALKKRLGSGPK